MQPRDYQERVVNAVDRSLDGGNKNPLAVMPTGAGKSVAIALSCARTLQRFSRWEPRIIVATHRSELVAQNHEKQLAYWPEAPAGIYSAQLGRRDKARITFANIQSIFRRAYEFQGCHVLHIDEAHLLSPRADGMYGTFIADCRKIIPQMCVVGWTATPFRLDSGLLCEPYKGHAPLFDTIAAEVTIPELLNHPDGPFLVPLLPYAPKDKKAQLNVAGVKLTRGDFQQSQLQAAVDKDDINLAIVREAIAAGDARRKWLTFAAGVTHAQHLAALFNQLDIPTVVVHGEMSVKDRAAALKAHRNGNARNIVNCDILTTGFDDPEIDLMVVARPTTSAGLWVQMMGRGMRPAPRKANCVVLDFAGNTMRHGPIDQIKGRSKLHVDHDNTRPAPCKVCPECELIVPASTLKCECGHEWVYDPYANLQAKPSQQSILSMYDKRRWVDVMEVTYHKHKTEKGHPALRVDYRVSLTQRISEYVNLQHPMPFVRDRAREWWFARASSGGIPQTVDDAMLRTRVLAQPGRIEVVRNGKHLNVTDTNFDSRPIGLATAMERLREKFTAH